MQTILTAPMNRPRSRYLVDPFIDLRRVSLQRKASMLSKAIFLDRDGTLNVEKGYITDPDEIELYPDSGAVLNRFRIQGGLVIIISNQSAVGQGLMTVDQFEQVNQALWDLLRQMDAGYDALYFCPHVPDKICECRKPRPGLILQAALDFNIDLSSSYFIGDKLSDIEAGQCAGCQTILVRTGFGRESEKQVGKLKPSCVQDDLPEALAWITERENNRYG